MQKTQRLATVVTIVGALGAVCWKAAEVPEGALGNARARHAEASKEIPGGSFVWRRCPRCGTGYWVNEDLGDYGCPAC